MMIFTAAGGTIVLLLLFVLVLVVMLLLGRHFLAQQKAMRRARDRYWGEYKLQAERDLARWTGAEGYYP